MSANITAFACICRHSYGNWVDNKVLGWIALQQVNTEDLFELRMLALEHVADHEAVTNVKLFTNQLH
jgi:N-acetylglutamate synthase-like GNAT family acetyltransferase